MDLGCGLEGFDGLAAAADDALASRLSSAGPGWLPIRAAFGDGRSAGNALPGGGFVGELVDLLLTEDVVVDEVVALETTNALDCDLSGRRSCLLLPGGSLSAGRFLLLSLCCRSS